MKCSHFHEDFLNKDKMIEQICREDVLKSSDIGDGFEVAPFSKAQSFCQTKLILILACLTIFGVNVDRR